MKNGKSPLFIVFAPLLILAVSFTACKGNDPSEPSTRLNELIQQSNERKEKLRKQKERASEVRRLMACDSPSACEIVAMTIAEDSEVVIAVKALSKNNVAVRADYGSYSLILFQNAIFFEDFIWCQIVKPFSRPVVNKPYDRV